MAKSLVILESPNKVKKVKSFLGKDFEVTSSKGHIRDLPPKKIGVNIKKNFEPTYENYPDKVAIIKNIVSMAKKCDTVYLMTDLDREGEYIAAHVIALLPKSTKIKRAKAGSITKKSVQEAIKNAGDMDDNLVDAAETRRILDRLVGWKCSFITQQATGGKSAGRVQSASLRIIAEREKGIRAFIPQEYWPIEATLENEKGEQVIAQIKVPDKLKIKNEKSAKEICDTFRKEKIAVSKYDVKDVSTKAYAPFTTSTIYQASSSTFGWGSKKTASVAQALYEEGLCLKGDEIITLSNGEIIQIKDAHKHLGKSVKAFGGIGGNLDLKVQNAKITDYQKIPYAGYIYNIRTLDGQEISATHDHKLLTYSKKGFEWKKASKLYENDIVICAKNIKCHREDKDIHIMDFISQMPSSIIDKILVGFNLKYKNKILKLIENNRCFISQSTYYKYKKNLKIPLSFFNLYYDIDFLKNNVKYFQWQSPGSKKEYIKADSFSYFLGLCLGDGHICKDKTMINFPKCVATDSQWEKISQGIICEQNLNLDRNTIQFSGKILYELCSHFGGAKGYKSDSIYVHPFISSLPERYVYNFIAGLFDSDGCLKTVKYGSSQKISISYTSISQNMLKQLNILLRTLGHSSSLHRRKNDKKNGNVKIWEESIYNFLLSINPSLIIKNKDVGYLLKLINSKEVIYTGESRNSNYPVMDIIEYERDRQGITKQQLSQYAYGNNSSYWNYTRHLPGRNRPSYPSKKKLTKINEILKIADIDSILNGDEYFATIKSIDIEYFDGYVYDISTSTENFIANAFYSHNCTYIRTDSKFIVPEFINDVRNEITGQYGTKYCPSKRNFYANKGNAQEAHEAIRVTDLSHTMGTGADNGKLYTMIKKRTVASQTANMEQEKRVAEFACKDYILVSHGSKVTFDGWRKVWDYGSLGDVSLPAFKIGEKMKLISLKTEQKFTTPPNRYNESSIVKKLETLGIGRPSTYASIIDTLLKRAYVEKQKKALHATDMGIRVSDFLMDVNFCFIDLQFTSSLETDLDSIASGDRCKLEILQNFWDRLKGDLENAAIRKDEASKTDFPCGKCAGKLILKHSKYGAFLTCENRTDKENPCDYKCDVDKDNKPKEKEVKAVVDSQFPCPNCGENLIIRINKKGGSYLGCRNWKSKKCLGFYSSDTGEPIVFKKRTYKKYKKKGKKKK